MINNIMIYTFENNETYYGINRLDNVVSLRIWASCNCDGYYDIEVQDNMSYNMIEQIKISFEQVNDAILFTLKYVDDKWHKTN